MATDVRSLKIDDPILRAVYNLKDPCGLAMVLADELIRLRDRVVRLEAEIERRNGDGR